MQIVVLTRRQATPLLACVCVSAVLSTGLFYLISSLEISRVAIYGDVSEFTAYCQVLFKWVWTLAILVLAFVVDVARRAVVSLTYLLWGISVVTMVQVVWALYSTFIVYMAVTDVL